MSGVVLTRHELRWVLEQTGGARWPYPLVPAPWAAETDDEVQRHRAAVERSLADRGLLAPDPARLLLRAGELVARWRVAVDLVRRDAGSPCAAVVLTDAAGVDGAAGRTEGGPDASNTSNTSGGPDAVLLTSTEHADAPVRVVAASPARMPETLVALVPAVRPGLGGPWPLTPSPAGTPGTPAGPAGPFPGPVGIPSTARIAHARAAVDELVGGATALTEVGVATRRTVVPVRSPYLISWLDGSHGRFAVRRPPPDTGRTAVLEGVDARRLVADIRSVLADAMGPEAALHQTVLQDTTLQDAARGTPLVPRSPGRSTA